MAADRPLPLLPIHKIDNISRAVEAAFAHNELLLTEADLGAAFFDLRSGLSRCAWGTFQ